MVALKPQIKKTVQWFFSYFVFAKNPESNYQWALKKIKNFPDENSLLVEIGSWDAKDSIYLAGHFNCKVIAFEPVPANISLCEMNLLGATTAVRDLVSLDKRCLSNETKEIKFLSIDPLKYGNMGASSLFKIDFSVKDTDDPEYLHDEVQIEIPVTATRYDATNYPAPHSIFMDVQGAEKIVLEGFGKLLQEVQNVVFESALVSNYQGGSTFWEVNEILVRYGLDYIYSTEYGREFPPKIFEFKWQGEFNCLYSRTR